MQELLISVVIPTFNRGDKILNTLYSLEQQTEKCFEVIIVNDGSTDSTEQILKENIRKYSFSIRLINQANKGRAGSRNTGFAAAKVDLVLSIDDDMRLDPMCVEEHLKHHERVPDSILVGVQKEDPDLAKTDIQRYLAFMRIGWLETLERMELPMGKDQIYITAANFSIPRILFNKIGGFDGNLNSYVDYDLAMRATELNVPIYYSQKALGWHDDFITCKSYIKRNRVAHMNWAKLKELRPDLIKKYNRHPEVERPAWKMRIYDFLANRFFVKTIDNFNFYQYILPQRMRFYIYDSVILSLSKLFPNRKID